MLKDDLKKILDRWGLDVVTEMQAILTAKNKIATQGLRNSIKHLVGEDFVSFTMAEYGIYVEEKTKPHWTPIGPLKKWASAKGLGVGAAYAARSAIHRRGNVPVKFFKSTIQKELVLLLPQLEGEFIRYMGDRIKIISDKQ